MNRELAAWLRRAAARAHEEEVMARGAAQRGRSTRNAAWRNRSGPPHAMRCPEAAPVGYLVRAAGAGAYTAYFGAERVGPVTRDAGLRWIDRRRSAWLRRMGQC